MAIVIPAYNEEENLAWVIEEWHEVAQKHDGTLVIINDGSRDNSLKIMLDCQKKFTRLLIIDQIREGKGTSCITGMKYAVENQFTWILLTDSSGRTDPKDFGTFWFSRSRYNFIFGTRPNREDGFTRKIFSKILSLVIFITNWMWINDPNVPYRLMSGQKLKKFVDKIPPDFFLTNALLSAMIEKQENVLRWPISFYKRKGRHSSIKPQHFLSIGINALKQFWQYKKLIRF